MTASSTTRFLNFKSRTYISLICLGFLVFGLKHKGCAQSHRANIPVSDKTASLLIHDAKSLPPEFAADIILRVIESGASLSPSQKVKALSAAFEEAAQSQDEVLRRPWGSSVEETSEGLHAIALWTGRLDRVSKQSEAVQDMARINPKLARVKLGMIALPRLDPPPCQVPWSYFPAPYYEAASSVLGVGFSPEEISSGRRGEFLTSMVNAVVSHSQLPPVTRLIRTSGLNGTELANVVSPYAFVLDHLRGDPHSFGATSQHSVDEFVSLVARLDKEDIGTLPLIASFRRYLVANLKTIPCSPAKPQESGTLPSAVQKFNDNFSNRLEAAGLTAKTPEEIKNEAKDTADGSEPMRRNSKEMSDLLLSLQELPDMPRENAALAARYREYILHLNGWSNQSEPEDAFFHQKAMLYLGVIERLGSCAIRSEAVRTLVKFLEQNSYQQVSKVDWFFNTRRLLDVSTNQVERSDVMNALMGSTDPVLNLYGRLESWKNKRAPSQSSDTASILR